MIQTSVRSKQEAVIHMLVGFAHPVFAWIVILAGLLFVFSLMWKAAKVAIFFVIVAVVAAIVFFAG